MKKKLHTTLKIRPTLLLLSLLTITVFPTIGQATADLEKLVIDTHREQGMKHGTLAVCVYNATTGKQVYAHNAELSMMPASVQKLLTTGVGFARLGGNFRFTTKIAVHGDIDRDGVLHGNIYITGGGDPLLGSYRYRQTTPDSLFAGWTNAIKKKGIRRVDGRVCYNVTIFDEQPLHDSWQWGDVGNYYAAGVSGLNFHENMYFVHFNAGRKMGHPAAVVRTVPKNIDIHTTCEVSTAGENTGDQVIVYGSPTSKERLYRGTVPLGHSDFGVRAAMPTPAKTCADLFSSYLRTHGVGVSSNSMQVYSSPDSLRPVVDYRSSSYYTIAQYTNLTSNNIYAESIFKYLGYAKYGIGSFANGGRAIKDYLREKGIAADGVNIADGSGLSRLDRVTADFMCRYLAAMTKEPFYNEFLQSIAKVGENGTAKNLLPNLPAGINVHVKTGTMDGVKAYAGYVVTPHGQTLSFAIISNGHDGSPQEVAAKLNKILYKIATLY